MHIYDNVPFTGHGIGSPLAVSKVSYATTHGGLGYGGYGVYPGNGGLGGYGGYGNEKCLFLFCFCAGWNFAVGLKNKGRNEIFFFKW